MSYKGPLGAGSAFVNRTQLAEARRPTPDSDALASSDDDHDHVPPARAPAHPLPSTRRPSGGWLQDIQPNRKFSLPSVSLAGSQPTTPSELLPSRAGPSTLWNMNSFTNPSDGRASRLKEVVPSPTAPVHDRALPSPGVDTDDPIGFLLNQGPIRKSVRSQSYSVGQPDVDTAGTGMAASRLHSSLRHRPSKPSLLGELAQLREDDDGDDAVGNGLDHGMRLGASYPDLQRHAEHPLLKQAALENAMARRHGPSASPGAQHRRKAALATRMAHNDFAIEEQDDYDALDTTNVVTRRFSEAVGMGMRMDHDAETDSRRSPWGSASLGLDPMGRRHSVATYGYKDATPLPTLGSNSAYAASEELPPAQPSPDNKFDPGAYFAGYGPLSRAMNASSLSAAHPDPVIAAPYVSPTASARPGRKLYVVAFKCSRADIFYVHENTGLEIRVGDLVIVEGDRGQDLGQVTHADVTADEARKVKADALEEHFRWLVMFSQYSLSGKDDCGMLGALARANGYNSASSTAHSANVRASPNFQAMVAQQDTDSRPKLIKRVAQQHEVFALRDKEGQEAKAKRLGAQKAAEQKLPMEILDAEYQADYHKLTYFYYAETYVNFNQLVTDIFKHFKVRIWMSAVNPASVVNPAGLMQLGPPSAIGPGAILHPRVPNALSVGPGFGNTPYRAEQFSPLPGQAAGPVSGPASGQAAGQALGQAVGHALGQSAPALQPSHYDDAMYSYGHPVPSYSAHSAFGAVSPFGAAPHTYGAYPQPDAGTPINYSAFYAPRPASGAGRSAAASPHGARAPSVSAPAFQPSMSALAFQPLHGGASYAAAGSSSGAAHPAAQPYGYPAAEYDANLINAFHNFTLRR